MVNIIYIYIYYIPIFFSYLLNSILCLTNLVDEKNLPLFPQKIPWGSPTCRLAFTSPSSRSTWDPTKGSQGENVTTETFSVEDTMKADVFGWWWWWWWWWWWSLLLSLWLLLTIHHECQNLHSFIYFHGVGGNHSYFENLKLPAGCVSLRLVPSASVLLAFSKPRWSAWTTGCQWKIIPNSSNFGGQIWKLRFMLGYSK